MKRKLAIIGLLAAGLTLAHGQGLLNKVKNKALKAGEKVLEKSAEEKVEESAGIEQNSGPSNNAPANTRGGGLVVTPPDVEANINDAKSAYSGGNYSDARYAVQQAMLGVELEIGHEVLESFPKDVDGLPADESSDQVTSTGWGWAGLTIQREYMRNDKQVTVTVANNSAWMSSVNMYLSNPGYASSGGQQNWKQIKVQDNRGIIEYNEGSGYKVSVPLGQTSLAIWEGVNFASEQEIMSAVNKFDLTSIKQKLGEQ